MSANLRRERLKFGFIPRGERRGIAFASKALSDGAAQSFAGAGDEQHAHGRSTSVAIA